MTLAAFKSLDHNGQVSATQRAVCIAGRDLPRFKVLLYQLDDFYVEVFYHSRYNCIHSLHAFDDTELLEPYLEKIPLQNIFSY
jgi:hypothetical protein